jgi:hypothetical protein
VTDYIADPRIWSVQAATAGIWHIFSPPALNIDYCAESFLKTTGILVREGCSVSRNDMYINVSFARGLREPLSSYATVSPDVCKVHYSST